MIIGHFTRLRPLEIEDTAEILRWENDPDIWTVSETHGPFTREEIIHHILEQGDLREKKQLRWMITDPEGQRLGLIDAFGYDEAQHRVSIGILIGDAVNRNKGLATDALTCWIKYLQEIFEIETVLADVHESNLPSVALFFKAGFTKMNDASTDGRLHFCHRIP